MKHSVLLTMLLILGACSTSPKNPDKQDSLTEWEKLISRLPKEVLIDAKGYKAITITVGPLEINKNLTNTETEHYLINDKYLSHVVTKSLNGTGSYALGTNEKWNNDTINKNVGYDLLELTTKPDKIYDLAGAEVDTTGFEFYKVIHKQKDEWTSLLIGGNHLSGKEDWAINVGGVVGLSTHYVLIKVTEQQELKMISVDNATTDGRYVINAKAYKETYTKI